MDNLLQSGVVVGAVWAVFGVLALYTTVVVWSHLSVNKLFWQNIFGSNRVALPRIAHNSTIPGTSSDSAESRALVLVHSEDENATSEVEERRGVIYPVAGRNGLHFWTQRCTSCQLCTYVCPVNAVTTRDTNLGYIRSFDLTTCIYCGLCEAACPTHAIRLTVNQAPTQSLLSSLIVQGEVEKKVCGECGRKVPNADLMADRIYDLDGNGLTLVVDETEVVNSKLSAPSHQQDILEKGRELAQPAKPCPVCQQNVLELEEKICG